MRVIYDIVIPVYNALEELKECIDSILIHTSDISFRIVIINDCSPDVRVSEYLNTLQGLGDFFIINNDENLGFIGSVNRGMAFSNNDIILLNSDTIVTSGWLRKLVDVAYSDATIATVTPLTNNGTICSIPNFCDDNVVPDGYTLDSFAQFIERISLRQFIEIPTGVGFCMFIKRAIINEVGLFDQETFGKGYGEENDFCCRVIEQGYKNVLADNVYVYHKGSMSFQGQKLNLLNNNLKLLNNRYPYYEKNVHEFIRKNPLKEIQDNIKIRMNQHVDSHKLKGNMLFVLHNFFDENYNHPVGGTEYHVRDLIENLKGYNAYVLVTNSSEIIVKQYREGALITRFCFPLSEPIRLTHFRHQEYARIVEKIIVTFEIGLIHIHHFIKHTFDIPYIAKKYGIKVIATLHDFYLFCPKINLLDENNQYCKDVRSENKCRNCLNNSFGFHTPFINRWKEQVGKMLEIIDLYICPSKSTENLFLEEYKQLAGKIITIEHGMKQNKLKVQVTTKYRDSTNGRIKIGFIGGLSPIKGSDIIYNLITSYPKERVEWHLIGGLGDQRLNLLTQRNLLKHGEYKREDLSNILCRLNIQLICLLSPWPETFSYTLSEAWNNHIPVVVTPMGALKERVESVNGGWVTDDVTLNLISKKIDDIYDASEEEWNEKIDSINSYYHKTNKQMFDEYSRIYSQLFISHLNYGLNGFENMEIMKSIKYFIDNNDDSNELFNNKICSLERELNAIKATVGWKVLSRLRERNHWSLIAGKKLIYLVLKYKKILR